MPYLPTGMWTQPTAYNKSLSGKLNGFPLFWNVQKA